MIDAVTECGSPVLLVERWCEATYFDGHNRVSMATRTQWDHESLHRTPDGVWVLGTWSDWSGSPPKRYDIITSAEARAWLIRCELELPPELELELGED